MLESCHFRTEVPSRGDRFFCSHSDIHSADSMVPKSACRVCNRQADDLETHATRRNPSTRNRGETCMFLGALAALNPQSRHCCHPSHDLTTIEDCFQCQDHRHLLKTGFGSVRNWAVGVTTAPRTIPTLRRMLDSLRRAGWSEAYIFAEPGSSTDGLEPGHRWCSRGTRLGMFCNWYLSLTELVLREPNADAFFLCQDDVVFCEGVRSYLEQLLWQSPSPHILSIYCAAVHDRNSSSGFHIVDKAWQTFGALALIFPNAVAHALLCDSLFLHYRRNGALKEPAGIDSVVGAWCQKSQIAYYVHSPSLAQHIGQCTTLSGHVGDSPRRSASSFPGESSNALALLGSAID